MKKIPLSKLMPVYIMLAILLFDVAIVIKDFIFNHAGTAVVLSILGVFLGCRAIASIIDLKKEYK
jgi:hypothetical protein